MRNIYSPSAFVRCLASLVLRHHGVEAVHVLPLSSLVVHRATPLTAGDTPEATAVYVQVLFTCRGWRPASRTAAYSLATHSDRHMPEGVLARYVVEGSVHSIHARWCAELQRVLGIIALLTSRPADTAACVESGAAHTSQPPSNPQRTLDDCHDDTREDKDAALCHADAGTAANAWDCGTSWTRSSSSGSLLCELDVSLPALALDGLCWRRDVDGLMGTHFYTVTRATVRLMRVSHHSVTRSPLPDSPTKGTHTNRRIPCAQSKRVQQDGRCNYHDRRTPLGTADLFLTSRVARKGRESSHAMRIECPWAVRVGALLNADIADGAAGLSGAWHRPHGCRIAHAVQGGQHPMVLLVLYACGAQLLTRANTRTIFDDDEVKEEKEGHGSDGIRESEDVASSSVDAALTSNEASRFGRMFDFIKYFTTQYVLPCLSLHVIGAQLDRCAHHTGGGGGDDGLVTGDTYSCPTRDKSGTPEKKKEQPGKHAGEAVVCLRGDEGGTDTRTRTSPSEECPCLTANGRLDDDVCHLGSICASYRCLRHARNDAARRVGNIVLVLDAPASLWVELYDEHTGQRGRGVTELARVHSAARQMAEVVHATLLELVVHNMDTFGFDAGARPRGEVASVRDAATGTDGVAAVGPATPRKEKEEQECSLRPQNTNDNESSVYSADVLIASIAHSISSIIARSPNMAFVYEAERLLSLHPADPAASCATGSHADSAPTKSLRYAAEDVERAMVQRLRAATATTTACKKRKRTTRKA